MSGMIVEEGSRGGRGNGCPRSSPTPPPPATPLDTPPPTAAGRRPPGAPTPDRSWAGAAQAARTPPFRYASSDVRSPAISSDNAIVACSEKDAGSRPSARNASASAAAAAVASSIENRVAAIQPSPSRAARRSAAGARPPKQIGRSAWRHRLRQQAHPSQRREPTRKRHRFLRPASAQHLHRFFQARPSLDKRHPQPRIFRRAFAHPHAEPQASAAEHIHFRRLLCHQRRLPLGQHKHTRRQHHPRCAGGEIRQQRQRLVLLHRSVMPALRGLIGRRVRRQQYVRHPHPAVADCLHPLRPIAQLRRVVVPQPGRDLRPQFQFAHPAPFRSIPHPDQSSRPADATSHRPQPGPRPFTPCSSHRPGSLFTPRRQPLCSD